MEPFIVNEEYSVAICKTCQFAVVCNEMVTHLRTRHRDIAASSRIGIVTAVSNIPGVHRNQASLEQLRHPEPTTDPIDHLAEPRTDGIRCHQCPYVSRQIQRMQDHCRRHHGWVNDWKKGGNVSARSKEVRTMPWTTGVRCQRFFPTRAGSRWFEVRRGQPPGPAPGVVAEEAASQQATETLRRLRQKHAEQVRASHDDLIRAANDKLEPNPWLQRVGWAEHLRGLRISQLYETMAPIREAEEEVLQVMWTSVQEVLERAKATSTPNKVGHAVLFEVQRKEVHIKPTRPFDNRMEEDTWARYKDVWRVLLCVWSRTQELPDDERPPYRFTERQGQAWDEFERLAEAAAGRGGATPSDALQQAALDMLIGILDHQLKKGHYENALVSALAVTGIRSDGGWIDITDYTTKYSAVIKVARMLVVYKAWTERQHDVARLAATEGEEAADDSAQSLFAYVRGMVQRFMTRTPGAPEAEPTPMDWILDTRTYGMHIQYNTPAPGVIDWVGDRVSYRRVRFTMDQLSDMLHGVVDEARSLLAQLTMVTDRTTEGGGQGTAYADAAQAGERLHASLPRIHWASIEDDHSETREDYSFLGDDRNTWLREGDEWVFRRIVASRERRSEWGVEGQMTGGFRAEAIRAYGRAFEQFRERLWLMMHMLGGQPGRATEIGGVRVANTVNGGVRNIFAHDGMMCFVTSYHKGYRSSGQTKIIHRYLPRETGELLVWYLWLVLPFWREADGISKQAHRYSVFLWADEVVGRSGSGGSGADVSDHDGQRDTDANADANADDSRATWTWKEDRTWTTDRARRIIQRHSARLLGNKLNVSMWRHFAIAIANRFLNEAFGRWDPGKRGEEEEDENDELGDSPWDLQAGHGTRIAGMIYARLLVQLGSGVAAKQQQFRKVSAQWHRFLGFGAEDRASGRGGSGSSKRKVELYDGVRLEARLRRFARLRQADMAGRLRQMTENDTATFRGNQERVVRAIVNGHSPIVQIMGTGGGKSLSFMLPAFCSPDGVTVVITPLTALRTDLDARCRKAGIASQVWLSHKNNQAASVIFVTPESAVSKGFRDFVARLEARQALDRVVVDECHVVLEGTRSFRPKLREVGAAVREFGVQVVCLTATLAPADEDAFFGLMGIERGRAELFRHPTTRGNIEYSVVTVTGRGGHGGRRPSPRARGAGRGRQGRDGLDDIDEACCRVAERWLADGGPGKAIIYAMSIERVERLSAALACPAFYSDIDTSQGKAERLAAWRQGSGAGGGLVVATNALGLGIDVPDVRLVIHAGMPRQLPRFVQESGRAGRDGAPSRSVVICRAGAQGGGRASSSSSGHHADAADEFTRTRECRRVVLDRVMDGRADRFECEAGEARCDRCQQRRWAEDVDGALEQGAADEAVPEACVRAFEDLERRTAAARRGLERERMREAEQVEGFRGLLATWGRWCVYCWCRRRPRDHRTADCADRGRAEDWTEVERGIGLAEREIFGKRRLENFSGCFECGLPQEMCGAWRRTEEEGERYSRTTGGRCSYAGRLLEMYGWGMVRAEPGGIERVTRRMMREEGLTLALVEKDEWHIWLGGLTRWDGMQCSRLCKVTYMLWEDDVGCLAY